VNDGDLLINVENVTLVSESGVVARRLVSDASRGDPRRHWTQRCGKDVAVQLITGVYQPQEGTITFASNRAPLLSVIGKKTHRIAQAGVSRTFQASRLFSALTVFETSRSGPRITGVLSRGLTREGTAHA